MAFELVPFILAPFAVFRNMHSKRAVANARAMIKLKKEIKTLGSFVINNRLLLFMQMMVYLKHNRNRK